MKKADTDRKQEEIKIQQRKIADELLEAQANAIVSGNYLTQDTDNRLEEVQPKQNRWSKYLEPEAQVNDDSEEDDPRYTTVAPQGKRKGTKLSSKTFKKPNNVEETTIPETTSKSFAKSQNMNSSISYSKHTPANSNTSASHTHAFNQFQSTSHDSDEDSIPAFQPPTQPPKQNVNVQSKSSSKELNSSQPKPSLQQPASTSGSRWSKYIEEVDDDEEDEDGQYVTTSSALDARYQVVRDPEESDE